MVVGGRAGGRISWESFRKTGCGRGPGAKGKQRGWSRAVLGMGVDVACEVVRREEGGS